MKWIDQPLNSFGNAIAASDAAGWAPFNYFTLWPYYAEHWLNKIWTAYEKAEEKKLAPVDLTKCFLGPLFLRQELVDTMFFAKSCNYDVQKTNKLLQWYNDILVAKCTEDPYGFSSTKILTKEDIAYLMKMFPFHVVDASEAREAGKLIHACEELSWSYFYDWLYWQCFEVYGPYQLPNNETLLLRAFTDLAPAELWPHTAGFEPSTVYVYTTYKDVDIKLDYWSHVITRDNLPQKMTRLLVLEHGRIIDKNEQLRALREKIEVTAVMQGKRFKELSIEELKTRELTTRCYAYRDLFTKLELSWKPSQEMLNSVKGKQLIDYQFPSLETPEEKKQFWKKLHDPREAYFPAELKLGT